MKLNNISRRQWFLAGGMTVLSLMVTLGMGCGSGGGGAFVPPPNVPIETRASLIGSQENPTPVVSSATGSALVVVDRGNATITVTLTTTGLTNVTMAHLHIGKAGTSGPIIFKLFDQAGGAAFPATLTKTLTEADLIPQAGSGINTFVDAQDAILAGTVYANVHTQANPAGEIRGQVGVSSPLASLTGDKEVPPVITTGTATFTSRVIETQDAYNVTIETANITLTKVKTIEIRLGKEGENGPVLFTIYDSTKEGAFTGRWNKTFTATDLQKQAAQGINSYSDFIAALFSTTPVTTAGTTVFKGNTYVNVLTSDHLDGEVRGQINP